MATGFLERDKMVPKIGRPEPCKENGWSSLEYNMMMPKIP
ncbi:hypothetical protein B4100_2000 [Heyndrickxia coagulans]|nr:hypothetical protein B4100_2000 [Heyndrickxia coagulans]